MVQVHLESLFFIVREEVHESFKKQWLAMPDFMKVQPKVEM
jgi:hypothetical protein